MQTCNFFPHRLPATSIIELMVSAALIGMVLTALVVNLMYTQRTLENTFLRSKATDMANSCMNYFRNARDNNEWPIFCNKIVAMSIVSTRPAGVVAGGSIYGNSSVVDPICPETTYAGSAFGFTVNQRKSGSGCSDRACLCRGARNEAYFDLDIMVNYIDAVGKEKTVTVTERFSRGQLDAEYRSP